MFVLSIFVIGLSGVAMAEKRNIFIGDVIELKVTSQNITIDELKNKFKEFEIIDIKEDKDSFVLTLRSFDPGEKTVQIGNKEIKINVKSALKEMKRDGIYEGETMPLEAEKPIEWKYVFFVLLGIFLVTGGVNLWWFISRRKKSPKGHYEQFVNKAKGLSPDDGEFLVKLTQSFKEYLESTYSCTIRGKTSSELIEKIRSIPDLLPVLPAVQNWLIESDRFKYMGITASAEKKQELSDLLLDLVGKIDDAKEVKQ
jgi:hypothetical protein